MISLAQIAAQPGFSGPPVSAEREGVQHNRVAGSQRCFGHRTLQAGLVIAGVRVQLPFSDQVLVAEIDVLMTVNVVIPGIVKYAAEIRGGDALVARAE